MMCRLCQLASVAIAMGLHLKNRQHRQHRREMQTREQHTTMRGTAWTESGGGPLYMPCLSTAE